MNKKEYIAPAIEVVEMNLISMFAGSVQNGGQIGGNPDVDFGDDGGELSNGRRGQWGNLWAEK